MKRIAARRSARWAGAVFALALVAAGCGDDSSTTETGGGDPTTTTMAGGHSHDDLLEVDFEPVPTLDLNVEVDPKAGFNVQALTSGHELAPEHASTDHVEGEGHLHLYVDGEKQGRLYNEWSHVGELEPGEHELGVELSANDHRALAVDGEKIMVTETVTVPESDPDAEHSHAGDAEVQDVTYEPVPGIEVTVDEDPKSGFNVHAVPTDFTLAPQNASTDPVDGEGHMHYYVDGEKQGRLYGEWLHVEGLDPGEHEIRVELSANDHSALGVDGTVIDGTVTVTQPEGEGDEESHSDDAEMGDDMDGEDHDMGGDADVEGAIAVEVASGEVVGGVQRPSAAIGEEVTVMVTSDADDHVHVHGYDLFEDVAAGEAAMITFTADIPGVFEIELEDSGLLLAELEVA